MIRKTFFPATLLVALFASASTVSAQALAKPQTGPVVPNYGPVFDVPDLEFSPPKDFNYQVVFEIGESTDKPGDLNPNIVSAARFLNMHARAGVPASRMKVAIVLHGAAGKDVLKNDTFRERYQVDNANLPLIEELRKAGVQFFMCGQTAMNRGLPHKDLAEPVQMALSAMTALAYLQAKGYQRVSF